MSKPNQLMLIELLLPLSPIVSKPRIQSELLSTPKEKELQELIKHRDSIIQSLNELAN